MRAVVLSPPVGMTLYVIQAVRREGNIKDVFAGTIPFVAAMSGASFDRNERKCMRDVRLRAAIVPSHWPAHAGAYSCYCG